MQAEQTVCCCRLIAAGSETITAVTATAQIQYIATVLWGTFDSYAPPGWNTYNTATRAYIGSIYMPKLVQYVSFDCAHSAFV